MKLNRLLIAAILLAGLSGLVWWSNKREKANEGKPAPDAAPMLLTLGEDSIRQVEIKHRMGDATVVKRDDANHWSITAPQPLGADQSAVSAVTNSVAKLGSERVVDDNLTDPAGYGLAPPAIELTFTAKDGKTTKLQIGDETPTGNSVYATVSGDRRLFTMGTYNKNNLDKTYKDLRDKRLMTFDSDKVSRVELAAKKGPVEFGRIAQNDWQILKPRPLRADGFQVEELVRKLKDATMDVNVSDADAKTAASSFGSAPLVAVAKVTDAGGTQTLEVHKAKDDYLAKSSVVGGVYKVNKDLGESLDKSADDFRNKKLFDFGFSDPNRIEFKDGAQSVVASKSGDKWTSAAGKELDSTSVQAFIDKIRDLTASKFPESGFGTQAMELTVVSNDSKRTEKVQIAPASAANFIARREGEAALYELEAAAVQDLRKAAGDVKEAPPPAAANKKK